MIVVPDAVVAQIRGEAEAAYPNECCGLLVGWRDAAQTVVSRARPSPNVTAGDPTETFEVSAQLRFDLMRELEGARETIVGHYHSHPDGPPDPSKQDLEQAWEPDLIWLIVAVDKGVARRPTAHAIDADRRGFRPIPLLSEPL